MWVLWPQWQGSSSHLINARMRIMSGGMRKVIKRSTFAFDVVIKITPRHLVATVMGCWDVHHIIKCLQVGCKTVNWSINNLKLSSAVGSTDIMMKQWCDNINLFPYSIGDKQVVGSPVCNSLLPLMTLATANHKLCHLLVYSPQNRNLSWWP